MSKKDLFFGPKKGYGFGGYPPPPLYGQNFQRIRSYGFGGYPPFPFTDKILKIVFDVLPNLKGIFYTWVWKSTFENEEGDLVPEIQISSCV